MNRPHILKIKDAFAGLQDFYILSVSALFLLFRPPLRLRETLKELDYAFAGSFFIVFFVSLFIGMALPLQISAELSVLGFSIYKPKIVGISIIRESGPYYWGQILEVLDFENVVAKSIKPFVFGYLITCISCYTGIATNGGAEGL